MITLSRKIVGISVTALALLLIITLAFVKVGIDQRDAFLCSAVHTNPELEMEQCPVHQNNLSWLLVSAFGIAFVLLGGGMYLLLFPAGSHRNAERRDIGNPEGSRAEEAGKPGGYAAVDPAKLNAEEKTVYGLLKEEGGSMYQSRILEKTGFSKAKVTRILDRLEHDERILERKRRGMTNIVVLK